MSNLRRWLYDHSVLAISSLKREANERIDVWSARVEVFNSGVRTATTIRLGVDSLTIWWEAVEQREGIDQRAKVLMQRQLKKLDDIIGESVIQERRNEELLDHLNSTRLTLPRRVNAYGTSARQSPALRR